jgi:hypothetical protein
MLRREVAMRTRTRQIVRMLADMRHSAHCRTLRYAATQQALRLAASEAEEEQDDQPPETSDTPSEPRAIHAVKRGTGFH